MDSDSTAIYIMAYIPQLLLLAIAIVAVITFISATTRKWNCKPLSKYVLVDAERLLHVRDYLIRSDTENAYRELYAATENNDPDYPWVEWEKAAACKPPPPINDGDSNANN